MHLLALDRGTKKIGVARRSSSTKITFPIGYIPNTSETLAHISQLIAHHSIDRLIYGTPHIPRMKQQLATLVEQLQHVYPELICIASDEAYTSVQADVLLQQAHHPGQDAVAAMYILDRYLETVE